MHVDDVCEALILMAERGLNQGVVQVGNLTFVLSHESVYGAQVGTGEAVTLKAAANVVSKLSAELLNGKHIQPAFDTSKPEGDRGRIAVIDRAASVLG